MSSLSKNPLDEVIELDFGKYWQGCRNKQMKIRTILYALRYGHKLTALPKEIQARVKQAQANI